MSVLVDRSQEDAVIAEALIRTKAMSQVNECDSEELAACAASCEHFINEYCYTFDPRPEAAPNVIPFKLHDFQKVLLDDLLTSYNSGSFDQFWEKSRDMGVSWLVLSFLIWCWRFQPGFQALIGSRVEDLVDNWEPDSMFWKLAFIVDHLPPWLRPRGYSESEHRHYLKLDNPENGNAIVGQSSNPNFSRQGRYTIVVLDEFQVWAWAKSAWTATADATTMRLVICTAEPGSFAKTLRNSGKVELRTIHWHLHPKKDKAWYMVQRGRRTEEEIAKELDINWSGTVRGRVYGDWERLKKGSYPYQRGWPLYVSWDFGIADETALVWWQQNPRTRLWRPIDCYMDSGHVIDWYVPFVTGQVQSGEFSDYSEQQLAQIDSHRGWPGAIHYGDPAGRARNQVTGTSVIEELRKHHIYVQTRPDVNEFEQRKLATQLFLRKVEGVNIPACNMLDDAMLQARYPERREGNQATTEIAKPIHDWTSHFRTSVEYMAVNAPNPETIAGNGLVVGSFKVVG